MACLCFHAPQKMYKLFMYSTAEKENTWLRWNNKKVAEAFWVMPNWTQLSGEVAYGGVCGCQVLGLLLCLLYPKGRLEKLWGCSDSSHLGMAPKIICSCSLWSHHVPPAGLHIPGCADSAPAKGLSSRGQLLVSSTKHQGQPGSL